MTRTPRSTPPTSPRSGRGANEPIAPKPYQFIAFPNQPPIKTPPAGHHKFLSDHLHGTLFLRLTVKTPLHVSTGIAVLGSDIGSRVPLIKTMVQGTEKHLIIQGSSLKGCVRAVYEAITNSTLAVITPRYRDKIPPERLSCRQNDQLCPASRVFGALDWQGLIEFSDAKCEQAGFATGFMPSLYRPRPEQRQAYFVRGTVAGRKFYYHAIRTIDRGQNTGIAVQQAAKEYVFTTKLQVKNLQPSELGTLLIVLGQDPDYPLALKIGGGKPIGMGTMTVQITAADVIQNATDFRQRYTAYHPPESEHLTDNALQQFMQQKIQTAHTGLIQKPQLDALLEVLRYPTDREPPTGMY
ncbi:MAG: CRISPR-associated protein [Leptolyngbyaceae cyanobacterium SU_3_3]|nr:CRISPR-associated protein [Leptolyngbyaceae cyanobacterium SU_3_3]